MVSNFLIYDVTFLILFAVFVSVFLYRNRENLKREGLLFLYRASWGIKLINYTGNKFKRTLKVLSYISVFTGYLLMAGMFYLLGRIIYIYISVPEVARQLKVPPITPLVPYLPQAFNLDFLPPFYFTYWIVIIAIIAITHEFAHGIFASYDGIKIKSTGFGFFPFFLPIFLAAFVELDEERMAKKKIFSQLSILSAGTFANVLTSILFFAVLVIFFSFSFSPAGVVYDTYPYSILNSSAITSVNGNPVDSLNYDNLLDSLNETGLNKIETSKGNFVATKQLIEEQKGENALLLYYDAPAINENLESVILKINNENVASIDELERELSKYSPEEKITLTLINADGSSYNRDVVLEEHPEKEDKAWLGIGFSQQEREGIIGKTYEYFASFKDPNVYYESKFYGSNFFYNLLWWVVIISISVALINMLPVGIFDGGRFFYLTILAATGSHKIARRAFAFSTYFILGIFLLLMLVWVYALIL